MKRLKVPPQYIEQFTRLWSDEALSVFDSQHVWKPTRSAIRNLGDVIIFGKSIKNWAENEFHNGDCSAAAGSAQSRSIPARHELSGSVNELTEFINSLGVANSFCRRIIITRKGYIGLGHAQSRPGDQIALLAGCSVPIILRERERGQPEAGYTLVGEAYVHGIMDGEAWDESLLTDIAIH